MKKQQTVINAEEQHLAEMSTTTSSSSTTTTSTVKKVKKTTNKSLLKKSSITTSIEEETIARDIKLENTSIRDARNAKSDAQETQLEDQAKTATEKTQAAIGHETKKKTKSKKAKKSQSISVKSSFSKFDALQKRDLIQNPQEDKNVNCKLCTKPVYKMEEIKAEKSIYHKNCFRCHECNKQLKVDNYQSHEGHPYCMIHFKLLFAPKAVEETEPEKPRKPELIIRENEPVDLPPDVVRASDMPDLGLGDLHQLNVRSRFQVFEKGMQQQHAEERLPQTANVKRSTTILSKVAKLQAHGFSGSIDGEHIVADVENSSTEQEDSSSCLEEDAEDVDLVRAKKRTRERPVGIGKAMNDIKTKFEKGPSMSKDERREERKQEIQNIRSRLFMGKQARIKEMYQQAVAESEQSIVSAGKKPEVEVDGVTRSLKERFEKGELFKMDHTGDNDLATNGEKLVDTKADTTEISEKFKFFETYRPTAGQRKQFRITPPREGVVKMPSPDDSAEDTSIPNSEETNLLEKSRTTAKMLDKFREMEKNKFRTTENGPRPLKCFTPPPDGGKRVFQSDDSEQESENTEEESSEEAEDYEVDDNTVRRAKLLADDVALKEAQAAARAKQLRAKFEKWEANEIQREIHDGRVDSYAQNVSDESNIESTKSIRERFENMKTAEANTPARPRYQVNRFV